MLQFVRKRSSYKCLINLFLPDHADGGPGGETNDDKGDVTDNLNYRSCWLRSIIAAGDIDLPV